VSLAPSRPRASRPYDPTMGWLLDAGYLAAATVASPVLLARMARRGTLRTDWGARLGEGEAIPRSDRPRILVHAVSVGEINACRTLMRRLEAHPARPEVVVAATTDTGLRRAVELYADRHAVVQYPFDLTVAVRRLLDRVKPDVVATVELEVWPNLTSECRRRGIPVVVVNGRLSPRSFRGYRRARPFVAPMFRRLEAVLAQDEAYAARFIELGVDRSRVEVAGGMKWDAAEIADEVPGAAALGDAMGIDRARPLVVAGSTAPGEEALLESAVPAGVQLLCAPRRPEWAAQAAAAMPGCARRSRRERGSQRGRFLLDTIGELRQAYALADVVVVGRSFGRLHGSDPVEPIALGRATVIGPSSADFQTTVEALRAGGGLIQCTASELADVLARLVTDPAERTAIASRGRAVIREHQGASDRAAERLVALAVDRAKARQGGP